MSDQHKKIAAIALLVVVVGYGGYSYFGGDDGVVKSQGDGTGERQVSSRVQATNTSDVQRRERVQKDVPEDREVRERAVREVSEGDDSNSGERKTRRRGAEEKKPKKIVPAC